MIIRVRNAVLIHTAAKNCMSKLISLRFNLPAAINKGVAALRRRNGIEHNGIIAARAVFIPQGTSMPLAARR